MVELVVRFAHYEHYQHILALVASHRVNLAPGLLFSHIFRAEKQQIYKFAFVFDDRQSCLILCEVQVNRDFTHYFLTALRVFGGTLYCNQVLSQF